MKFIKLVAMFGNKGEEFVSVDNHQQIKELIDSKSSATWGCGAVFPDTGWVKLAQYSPNTPSGKVLVVVCKLEDFEKAKELK